MLLNLPCCALLLHLHTNHDVEVFSLCGSLLVVFAVDIKFWLVCVLHVVARMMSIGFTVHTSSNEVVVEFRLYIVFTLKVNHRACFTFFIYKEERRYMGILCHLGVISTECGCDVHNTRTVFCCDIVAGDYAECTFLHLYKLILACLRGKHLLGMLVGISCGILRSEVAQLQARLHPRHQLLILVSNEFLTCIFSHNAIRHHLVAMLVCLHIGILALGLQISVQTRLCHDDSHLLVVIRIICLHCHILDVWTYAECGI